MKNDPAPSAAQEIATLPLNQAIDAFTPQLVAVLPQGISVEHFKRLLITAININPDLAQADRRSLFNACVKCASDGLLPDGREAALVVFNTKVKRKVGGVWQEEWVPLVQYMIMIAGIRKRMRNSGEVVSATAEVVCENDEFDYALGDEPFIHHKPAAFQRPRGKPVGAYAIIKLKSGEILRDVMRRDEIEAARSKSRAKDSLMWTDFWGEGAKKTTLRRCAKAAPQSAVMEALLARDDELPEMPPHAELAAPDPEPPRGRDIAITHQAEPEPEPEPVIYFHVADMEGELHEFTTEADARDALGRILDDATRRGPKHVAAVREDNAALIREIGDPRPDSPAGTIQSPSDRKETAPALDTAHHQPAGGAAPRDLLGGKPEPDYHVKLTSETSDGWEGWRLALWATIKAAPAADMPKVLRQNDNNLVIYEQIDAQEQNKMMRALGVK